MFVLYFISNYALKSLILNNIKNITDGFDKIALGITFNNPYHPLCKILLIIIILMLFFKFLSLLIELKKQWNIPISNHKTCRRTQRI